METRGLDGSDPGSTISWVEATLIEAWAASLAPPGPVDHFGPGGDPAGGAASSEPWYACYGVVACGPGSSGNSSLEKGSEPEAPKEARWRKALADTPSEPQTHGAAYYYDQAAGATQWERPADYESPDEADAAKRGAKGAAQADSEAAKALLGEQRRLARW